VSHCSSLFSDLTAESVLQTLSDQDCRNFDSLVEVGSVELPGVCFAGRAAFPVPPLHPEATSVASSIQGTIPIVPPVALPPLFHPDV
jgi:hypothetical protein